MRGTPHSTEEEERCLDDAESVIRYQLSELFGTEMLEDEPPELSISTVSSTVKLELALLLRHQVATSVEVVDDPSLEEPGPICTITLKDFHTVRSYLEEFGDLSILADIVGIAATSLNAGVLASASDTLHYHRKSFQAIGAFEVLFGKITKRYAAIRTIRLPDQELLLSLTDLSHAAQADGKLMQALTNDLSRLEQMNSVVACSPVSDTMAEVIHSTAVDSDEEIDRVLSSGTSMDRPVLARVFGKIIVNLEEQIKEVSSPSGNHAIWLRRLRSFDEAAFEGVMVEWLESLLTNHQAKLNHAVLPALVKAGCLTLAQYARVARVCINKRKANDPEDALRISMDALDALLPSEQLNPLCQLQEAYRYRLEQNRFCHDPEQHILELVRETLEFGTEPLPPALQRHVTNLLSSNRMYTVVKHFALKDIHSLSTALGIGTQSFSAATCASLKSLLDNVLDPFGQLRMDNSLISPTSNANFWISHVSEER